MGFRFLLGLLDFLGIYGFSRFLFASFRGCRSHRKFFSFAGFRLELRCVYASLSGFFAARDRFILEAFFFVLLRCCRYRSCIDFSLGLAIAFSFLSQTRFL